MTPNVAIVYTYCITYNKIAGKTSPIIIFIHNVLPLVNVQLRFKTR